MARKKKRKDLIEGVNNKEGAKHKISAFFIVLIIVFIWLAIFTLLIKLDVGSFGSSILRPLIKDVPIINRILPSVPDSQVAYENDYPYKSIQDAIDKIKELEKSNKTLTKKNQTYKDKIKELEAEVAKLKVFEDNQAAFEKRVKDFETNVVLNDKAPDITEYKKYYEAINPTNAEEIYRQVVEQIQISDSVKQKADIYRKMDPAAAASIFQTMTADIDLVSQMLLSMNASESSAILAAMDSTAAAKITKKMFAMDQANQN
jgi:flagellar motility protein MotE (MotC chaperone)